MRLFYYVHTGHRIGLDRFRRAATIIRSLGDVDITLLTSDFRIASMAREYGIKRAVGVDVVRNIPQIANNGDKIIFDSAEINPVMLDDMTRYFSTFIRISDDPNDQKHPDELLISPYLEGEGICKGVAVDDACFEPKEKTIERVLFFGDDDYEEDLAAHQETFSGLDLDVLQGFYWFFGYENKLTASFKAFHDEEAYDEVVAHSKVLVSASPQAVLEHLAGGGRPVYLQREDYPTDFIPLFESLGIPVLDRYDHEKLSSLLSRTETNNYKECPKNTLKIATFIKQNLDL
ncbi:MAG: hypothetical protein P8Y65_00135 [Campylobacterales bacterium]|jgi:hypothetical protein